MAVVLEIDNWCLDDGGNGEYEILEKGDVRAKVVTLEHEPSAVDSIEVDYIVRDESEAKDVFRNYVEKETGYMG